jgi:hypothetical protein
MQRALKELTQVMDQKKNAAVDVVLKEAAHSNVQPLPQRMVSIYGLTAIDDLGELLDILASEDPAHRLDRDVAVFALRRWLSQSADRGRQIYDFKEKQAGALMKMKRYSNGESATLLALLHDFSEERRQEKETFEYLVESLNNPKVAIRELAYWHLIRLAGPVKVPVEYNAAAPKFERERAAAEWKKLVETGKVPAPAVPPPPPPR